MELEQEFGMHVLFCLFLNSGLFVLMFILHSWHLPIPGINILIFWLVPLCICRDAPCHCFKNWVCLLLFLRWPFLCVTCLCLILHKERVLFFAIQNQILFVCEVSKIKKKKYNYKHTNTDITMYSSLSFFSLLFWLSSFCFKCQLNCLTDHYWKNISLKHGFKNVVLCNFMMCWKIK